MQKQKGFTLIELLVVISVIGLLASIILVSLNSARDKARQTKLKADFAQIEKQIDIARGDQNKLAGQIGTWCTSCSFNNTQSMKSQTAAIAANSATWQNLGFASAPSDPWSNPYTIDENEQENSPANCAYDVAYSAGPNGIFEGQVGLPSFGVLSQGLGDDYVYGISHWVCQ